MSAVRSWLTDVTSIVTGEEGGGLRGELVRGGAGSLAIQGVQVLLTLGVMVLLARLLGAEGYGVYAYVFALVEIFGIPAQTGIGTLTVREVAAYRERGGWPLLRGFLRFGLASVVIFGIVVGAVTWAVTEIFPVTWSRGEILTMAAGALLLPLRALSNFRGAALRGLKRIVRGLLPEFVIRPGGFLLLCGGLWLFPTELSLTPSRAMLFHAVAAGGAFVAGSWMLTREMPGPPAREGTEYEIREWISSIGPLSLITGMQVINSRADIVMLGFFETSADVGVYRIAAQGGILVVLGLKAINMAVGPHFSSLWASRDTERLQKLATAASRVAFVAAVPVAFILMAFGGDVLGLVFGREFRSGHLALAIICVGQLINAAVGSVVLLLNMTGHETVVARGMVVAAVANVALNLVLIPLWGMEGAAAATVITFGLWNVLLWKGSRKRLSIDTSAFVRMTGDRGHRST